MVTFSKIRGDKLDTWNLLLARQAIRASAARCPIVCHRGLTVENDCVCPVVILFVTENVDGGT